MELKATLQYPFTPEQKRDFIITQNRTNGYEIRFVEREITDPETEETITVTDLQAWGLTEEEQEAKERQRLDALTLTPADVERALYKAKSMNFDDLIEQIEETVTGVDMKALKIEFKASLFYRGAKFGNNKLFDVIGNMLGYTADDMDYLFEHKELPTRSFANEL